MSEERPTFKITDRRLFNADGSPRDIEREEEDVVETSSASPSSSSAFADSSAAPADRAGSDRPQPPGRDERVPAPNATMFDREEGDLGAGAARPVDDAGDPTQFVNLLMFIASPAAAALGMTEHPGMGGRDVDLPLAKHCIDLLGTLREKTEGNLSAQERQIFEGLLTELRMQYVSLTSATRPTASGPRGFTGSDITGGR